MTPNSPATISLQTLIQTHPVSAVLADASGVLYTDEGVVPGAHEAVAAIQQAGIPFIVVTNNTDSSTLTIASRFQAAGLAITADQVISSGMGLEWDAEMKALVDGHPVYIFGKPDSHVYIKAAGGIPICDRMDTCRAVVMAATLRTAHHETREQLIAFLNQNPKIPVICINPDRYIMQTSGKLPVVGYDAQIVETQTQNPFYWVGKPEARFATVVQSILKSRFGIACDPSVWFFDDNPDNVHTMTTVLGISGGIIYETGLAKHTPVTELQTQWPHLPIIRSFSLK